MANQNNQSNPVDQMGAMMEKKVGGKMTLGQYFKFQWKYYMWLLIAAVVVGAIGLIPSLGLGLLSGTLGFLVWAYAAFVYFWFGYQLAKMNKGDVKEALIGGGILGVTVGVISGIFGAIGAFILISTATFGVFGSIGVASAIGSLVWNIFGGAIVGLVISLIGFAVAGGFNKTTPTAPTQQQ